MGQPFVLAEATTLLERTPRVLDVWLRWLPETWITATEGGETWSAFDIIGHLIHGEHTDWMPRVRRIVESGPSRPFDPFDRTAMFVLSQGKNVGELLDEFAEARAGSLRELAALQIGDVDLAREGRHPQLGSVTLRQLLATWVAHDLDHISQIARVLAHQHSEHVGPWRAYLRVISGEPG
jgi:hypothetical protein